MLSRLTIKNYRTFDRLDLGLGPSCLFMGRNGSGKTSVFDALWGIRRLLVDGCDCAEAFPLSTTPRWLADEEAPVSQEFSLTVESPWGALVYRLLIEHFRGDAQSVIQGEELLLDEKPLFRFHWGEVQLFREDSAEGPQYPADNLRSALANVPSRGDQQKLSWFKKRVANIVCVRFDAPRMSARSEKEERTLERDASNFASWYRHALLSDAAAGAEFLAAAREVLEGLRSLNLRDLAQGFMLLEGVFSGPAKGDLPENGAFKKTYTMGFHELSDGQRALLGLYAALHFLVREDCTLCIDEPDNFIALSEIQPWLAEVMDAVDEHKGQIIIASHHPELYDFMAADHGIRFDRQDSGPPRVEKYVPDADSPLSISEQASRGQL